MDAQCQGSVDLYCSCGGVCLPTDAAILPTGPVASDCQTAKDLIANLNKNVAQLDLSGLSSAQRSALATDQCCRNCNKGMRLSQVGFLVDCATKTISSAPPQCNLFSLDPLALANCPVQTTSDALLLGPAFTSLVVLFML